MLQLMFSQVRNSRRSESEHGNGPTLEGGLNGPPTPAPAIPHRAPATGPATGHRTGHRPPATGHRPPATGHRLPDRLPATGHWPPATGYRTGHRTPTKKVYTRVRSSGVRPTAILALYTGYLFHKRAGNPETGKEHLLHESLAKSREVASQTDGQKCVQSTYIYI